MPPLIVVTQVLLPLLLLAWVLALPGAGSLAYLVQVLAIALFFLGIALAGLWAMPPFWVPWLYAVLLAGIVAFHFMTGRIAGTALWSSGPFDTTLIVLGILLGLAGGYYSQQALLGRRLPEVEVVDIAPPFPPGTYLVANGGSTPAVNIHLRTLDESVPRYRPWRGQSRAFDIIRINPFGLHMRGLNPADPARYLTFGTPLLAPCAGTVVHAVDGLPDMRVPQMDSDNLAGNHVVIDCGDFHLVLAHLRRGSMRVAQGDEVRTGDILGEMGNSGNSSQPHLHVHAQRGFTPDAPLGGEPLGLTIDGRFYVRNDRIRVKQAVN